MPLVATHNTPPFDELTEKAAWPLIVEDEPLVRVPSGFLMLFAKARDS